MSLVMTRCRAETRTYHPSDYELMRYVLSQDFGVKYLFKGLWNDFVLKLLAIISLLFNMSWKINALF